ncbi:MAG: 4-alpha-glucanotransferase [Steroidobacteraceae bacterium]
MPTTVLTGRRAGALLPLSCLSGALGREGRAFVDWLAGAGFSVWQFLPVGPPGPDGSPYWTRSDSAGSPALLDREEMPALGTPEHRSFLESARSWLGDYAAFEAISRLHGGAPWWSWPAEHRDRDPRTLEQVRREQAEPIREIEAQQFAFAWQWRRLREHARSRGVLLCGDLPFYVAPSSAETWAHRGEFQLDATGRPRAVAGVPPDYFSPLGQLWGNPLYDWDAMVRNAFAFWRNRLRCQLERVDLLRLDHFRALAAHWAVPADAPDARSGEWKRTPGWALLRTILGNLGDLPLVAEDLGVITPDVEDLRRAFGLPGMRVLQFGFDGSSDNPHLPHMHERDCVVYTGTHDNDTTAGWYASLDADTARRVDFYLGLGTDAQRASSRGAGTDAQLPSSVGPGADATSAALVRSALASVSALAMIPVQDILALGSGARFNTPATTQGNWLWRLPVGSLTPELAGHYLHLNRVYGRAR